MSNINVDTIKNRSGSGAPGFPNGLTVTGVATATTFSGNLTGNLNSSGVSTVSELRVGTGVTINSGIITATEYDITGSTNSLLSGGLTINNINSSGISTINDLRLASVADRVTVATGTGVTLAYNSGGGNIAVVHTATGPITLTVTGIPTTSDFNNRSLNFAVIVRQGAIGYGCSSLVLNGVTFNSTAAVGVSTRISYPSGSVATGSTSCYDIFNFIGINTTGSASTMTNYNFISIKNGDFRFY